MQKFRKKFNKEFKVNKVFKNFKLRDKDDHLFSPYKKRNFVLALDYLIDRYYLDNLLFFGLKIEPAVESYTLDYYLPIINYEDHDEIYDHIFEQNEDSYRYLENRFKLDYKDIIFDGLGQWLNYIDLLEFAFVSRHYNKKTNKYYYLILFGVKSITGYISEYIDSITGSLQWSENKLSEFINSEVVHLKGKNKTKKYLSFMFKDYDFENKGFYFRQASSKSKLFSNLWIRDLDCFNKMTDFGRKGYLYLSAYVSGSDLYYKRDLHLDYNFKQIRSVKEISVKSIFNVWNTYMLLESLYYSIEDNKIYKKISLEEKFSNDNYLESSKEIKFKYEYFSELDYLRIYFDKIIYYLSLRYEFIKIDLLRDYLEDGWNKLLLSPRSYIPVLYWEKLVSEEKDKIAKEKDIIKKRRIFLKKEYSDRFKYNHSPIGP